ncbi:peptidase [Corynebacterium ulcerans]|nr:peptidase [Corynebacterium ulcerans]
MKLKNLARSLSDSPRRSNAVYASSKAEALKRSESKNPAKKFLAQTGADAEWVVPIAMLAFGVGFAVLGWAQLRREAH